jgi:hypothetical protein
MISPKNKYILHGEVVEVLSHGPSRKIKVICKPGAMIIETSDADTLTLGDAVIIKGSFEVDTLETTNIHE